MTLFEIAAYAAFPYICLTLFALGHAYRYLTDRYGWNARSSEFLEKKSLRSGSVLFHWGILLTLLGHAGGLLIPQRIFDRVGIDSRLHMEIALWSGLVVGALALAGAVLLLYRRVAVRRVSASSPPNDLVVLAGLLLVIGLGFYNVLFDHYNVLYTLAPWIRGIVLLSPQPELMRDVPPLYKAHTLTALALLAYSPFSRLVHIWSVPLTYLVRPWIVLRRKAARG